MICAEFLDMLYFQDYIWVFIYSSFFPPLCLKCILASIISIYQCFIPLFQEAAHVILPPIPFIIITVQ